MAFTLPYFQSSLSILSRVEEPSFLQLLSPFFSRKFFYSVCVFLFILAAVGFLLWLAEREANPKQFPGRPLSGIGNGMWCAITTMSTTGYGDVVPRTFWGRFIAGAWMVVSLISATTLVAGIASSVTLTGMRTRTVQHAEDLKGQRVATLKGSTSVPFIQLYGGTVVPVETLDEGAQALKDRQVSAMVYDRPQLAYYVQVHPGMGLAISSAEYDKQGYGFAFPLSFRQVHEVNVTLLELKEDGFVDRITTRWLGGKQ
jgi:polar amino acid transport system substrate-binding protein